MSGDLSLFEVRDLRAHDLPPSWDGLDVVWEGWQPAIDNIFICPPPKHAHRCSRCGSTTACSINRGAIRISGDNDIRRPLRPAMKSAGARWVRTLTAFRCGDCSLDTVVEGVGPGSHVWTLDENDYTDEGSRYDDPPSHRDGRIRSNEENKIREN